MALDPSRRVLQHRGTACLRTGAGSLVLRQCEHDEYDATPILTLPRTGGRLGWGCEAVGEN